MMLKLIAVASEDGWGFVEDEGRTQLVRPPFRRTSVAVVSRATVDLAIAKHGFSSVDIPFADWGELIAYLWRRLEEERAATVTGKAGQGGQILRNAPLATATKIVARVKDELLPQGEWATAFTILTHVLRNQNVKDDSILYERAVALLDRCHEEMTGLAARRHALVGSRWREMFPGAAVEGDEAAIEEYKESIRRRGQLMIVGDR